jgi:tetratricopeptide (TPR) repeat protein
MASEARPRMAPTLAELLARFTGWTARAMMARMRLVWAGALAAVVLFTSLAHAQQSSEDQQARALFDAGHTAYDAGRFEQALRYFREAYELSHRPALLFNIASAADRLLEIQTAIDAYQAYLDAMPNADNRELAMARIEFLRGRLAAQGGQPARTETQVPTPEETARISVGTDAPRSDTPRSSGGGDVTGEWWFWTLIAVLVVGAGVGITAGVVVGTSSPEQPLGGDVPITMALEGL